jgi:hypothetical protein
MTSDLPAPDKPVTNIIDLFNVKTLSSFYAFYKICRWLTFFLIYNFL